MKIQSLYVYHRELRSNQAQAFAETPGFLSWNTCVRSILIGTKPLALTETAEIYANDDAFQFLTEVVCGLRSPMLGETEVHGQFNTLLEQAYGRIDRELYGQLMAVHFVSKRVRQLYLQNLGAQSYGSFTRKKLSEYQHIGIVGAGHLAQEILPWFSKGKRRVQLLVRESSRAIHQFQNVDNVSVVKLKDMVRAPSAVIIAAPMPAIDFKAIFGELAERPLVTIDLRSEGRHDPLCPSFNAISLEQVFEEIEKNKHSTNLKVSQAKELIALSVKDLEATVGRQLSSIKI